MGSVLEKKDDGQEAPEAPMVMRPVGHFERYMEADYYWDYQRGNFVTCRYVLPEELADVSRHEDAQESLVRALARTTLDHPMLQVVLVGSKERVPKFGRMQRFNLDQIITWYKVAASEDYGPATDKIMTEQVNKKWDDGQSLPGWRIIATRPEKQPFIDVHLLVRHTMFDGESRNIFHRTLLDHLNSPQADEKLFSHGHVLELASKGDEIAFPPPMEKYGKFTLEAQYVLSKTWQELRPSFMVKPTETQRSWGPFKPGDYRTQFRTVRVDATTTQKIIEACRAHKTTVTAFVHGIIVASLLWECRNNVKSQSYAAETCVNLRRFMPDKPRTMPDVEMDPNKTIANMLTVIDHDFSEADMKRISNLVKPADGESKDCRHYEDVVWEVAKSTRHEIEEKMESGLKNDVMNLMKLVYDWRSEKKRAGKKARYQSWCLTNLGAVDGKPSSGASDKSSWHISHANFVASVDVTRSTFLVSVISVKGGDMCISLAWQCGLGDYVETIADQLTRDMHSWCHYIASSSSKWSDDWEPQGFAEHLKGENSSA